ncbi:AAA family ATPase [Rhizobium leguminosarum]|uniref:AAA family ATPase n=1 Tax=Rhizobium leguminosarum TaxID=384 RepID=UPI001C949F18|nr:AAA family ATPase [Rhizobium leguminosarum]MBY5626506.1 hypothetical protein [Rhizobium leguminosarum]
MNAAAPTPAAATTVIPPRIKSFTLCDFRAFAGPEPVTFQLDGKNLLIYGENGAGKSSVFHALDEFFSVARGGPQARRERLLALKNIFSGQPETGLKISVEFDDGMPAAEWTPARHPVDITPAADDRVKNAAYRKAILDYRSLLETNYRHGDGPVNLFDVCINLLLRDFEVPVSGNPRLIDIWQRMQSAAAKARRRSRPHLRTNEIAEINTLCLNLNEGLRSALSAIQPYITPLLKDLGWDDIAVTRINLPGGVTYSNAGLKISKEFDGCVIDLELEFRGNRIDRPQTFLNEARLSALALAIYFAGRRVCAATLQADTPRLIVLDDVLIGLDQSNRMPVLRMLDQHFEGWQIVLLTHDRVWYEMARFHLADRTDWASVEMFEEKQPDGTPIPIAGPVRPFVKPTSIDAIAANIATARKFHGMNEYAAAAVHARVAFELTLKKLCERKSVPVRFKTDPRELNTEDLLTAIENWLDDTKRAQIKPSVEAAIKDVRLARKVVLNQFSHSTPVNLADIEVKSAIDAVEKLHADFHAHIPK